MTLIEIGLPGTLLIIKSMLKLLIDKSATFTDIISATLALPVDIIFLAASLLIGYTIANPNNTQSGLLMFMVCVACAIFVIAIWRRSEDLFRKDSVLLTSVLGAFNILISSFILLRVIKLLTSGELI